MAEASAANGLKLAVWLTAVMGIGWVLCFWPARLLNGESGVWWMTLAAVCCLVPGWIVVFLSGLAIFPNDLAAMLVQTMLRLGIVSAVAVSVKKLRPELGVADFFGWLIGFYLLALATEVLVVRKKKDSTGS